MRSRLAAAVLSLGLAALPALAAEPALRDSGPILIARVAGTINPASADYIVNSVAEAQRAQARLLLIELDTPGGMLASSQEIVQALLGAEVPVVVYVTPRGAWAASAGTFITMAGHIAAMAPGTSIGAAHPVSAFGPSPVEGPAEDPPEAKDDEGADKPAPDAKHDVLEEKVENMTAAFIEGIARERGRNVEWAIRAVRESLAVSAEEAVKLHVVDLVARDRKHLLAQLEGRVVELSAGPERLVLAQAPTRELPMGLLSRFLHAIWDPTIALALLSAGGILLWIEFSAPGVSLPGVLGVACILVAVVSLQVLPFSWLGLTLFVCGLLALAAEMFVSTHGLLFGVGVVAMLLGGSMAFDRPDVSDLRVPFWTLIVPLVAGLGGFGLLVAVAVGRVLRKPARTGTGELIGLVGTASTRLAPSGTVFVRGESWNADADTPVEAGARVEVTAIEGLRLRVRGAPRRGP